MNNKKRKIMGITIIVILILGIVIGISYAWWTANATQESVNIIQSNCLKVELVDDLENGAINIDLAYPLTDSEAEVQVKPYVFSIKNKCSTDINYELSLEILNTENRLASEYIAMEFNGGKKQLLNEAPLTEAGPTYNDTTTGEKGIESRYLSSGIIEGNGSQEYKIKLWIDEHVTINDDAMNKTFKSKIVVNANLNYMPKLVIGKIDTTDTSIRIPFETENGITTKCKYGTSETELMYEGTIENDMCILANLTAGVRYYYEIEALHNKGGKTIKSGNKLAKNPIAIYDNASVGDYVSYTPKNTSYIISSDLTGYSLDQIINPSELNLWRIISKNEDGTIDMISEFVGTSKTNKWDGIIFYGLQGYKNYIGVLNKIASSYETNGITSNSRHFGYFGQTEYLETVPITSGSTHPNHDEANSGELKDGIWLYKKEEEFVKIFLVL